ncbi:MAG: hypothetical protein V1875_03185 [Candidatus Altiarchaeota archaeon]
MESIFERPYHLPILAAYPAVFLYSRNVGQAAASGMVAPLALMAAVAGVSYALFRLAFGERSKAALAASASVALFFSYGTMRDVSDALAPVWAGPALPLAYLAGWAASLIWIHGAEDRLDEAHALLNLAALTLVILAVNDIVSAYYLDATTPEPPATGLSPARMPHGRPDIYYIVLDSYPSQETLHRVFGYDNSGFLRELEARGFYVAGKSRANYACTFLSLASSLNMDYMDGLVGPDVADASFYDYRAYLLPYRMIRDSAFERLMKSAGYMFISFRSGWGPTDHMTSADIEYGTSAALGNREFLDAFIRSTALRLLRPGRSDETRADILYTLDNLGEVAPMPGQKLVLAHIMSPHPPFYFDGDGMPAEGCGAGGEGCDLEESKDRFVRQLSFVNVRTLAAVDEILANSETPPIIIIQGDHGTWSVGREFGSCFNESGLMDYSEGELDERMGILNAYHLPDGGDSGLYESMSPVNTFRWVSDYYMGQNLTLLPDRSRFSCWNMLPYRFRELGRVT